MFNLGGTSEVEDIVFSKSGNTHKISDVIFRTVQSIRNAINHYAASGR